jgi:hypothetical protein
MKFFKKSLACFISGVILCSGMSFLSADAAQSYVYADQATVFDLIKIRRSIINDDGNYTLSDYNTMSNFLLKRKSPEAKKVTVTYDTEGLDLSAYIDPTLLDTNYHYCGTQYKILPAMLSKDGFIHGGWMYDGVVYASNSVFIIPESDVVFTPFWYANHTITYNAGNYDDILGVSTATTSGTAGTKTDLAGSSRFSRKGYTLIGWVCSVDGLTYGINDSYLVPDEDVIFTAVWKPATYTVSISANNGITTDRYTTTATCGDDFVLPECEFTNGTKTFAGWKFSGSIYQPGESFVVPALTTGEKVVITATWK